MKKGTPMIDHLNAFLSMVNQLATMKMMNDEMLATMKGQEGRLPTQKTHRPLSSKVEEKTRTKDKKFLISPRECLSPKIKLIASIVAKRDMKKNCCVWIREQSNQIIIKKDTNTTTSTSKSDEVLVLSYKCLHVGDLGVDWIVNIIASCYSTSHLELFSD